jgi:phosphoglucosamine mutase
MQRLFGTDGVRGVAGRFPLSASAVVRLATAAGRVLRRHVKVDNSQVLIVRDTRGSGAVLFRHLAKGLTGNGLEVHDGGVLSTPAAAHLVRALRFQAGVVISASHNPPEFNGIKFFTSQGRKWPDAWEHDVEKLFFSKNKLTPSKRGRVEDRPSLQNDYVSFLIETLGADTDFSGLRIAVDCSNGANYRVAPALLQRLGAEIFVQGANPDGKNINVDCGSQHTASLRETVRRNKCDLGVAFDGDGDRVVLVDETGRELDGDYIIGLLARSWKQQGRLKGNRVVITVMANLGLKKALGRLGIRSTEVSVGDRFVSEAMSKTAAVIGGEQSGHIILGDYLPTGDGLLTALHLIAMIKRARKPLSKLATFLKKYPQVLMNVRVSERIPLDKLIETQRVIRSVQKKLKDNGRVLVRYSGTEPLLRIMLEGPKRSELDAFAKHIASTLPHATARR